MKILPIDLDKDYGPALAEAINVLRHGGAVVYPTDTVYGLGANACDHYAAELIFKIKNRPLVKPLPIIARNLNWVKELAFVLPKIETVLSEIWPARLSHGETQAGKPAAISQEEAREGKPGAVTVILPKKPIIPAIVTAGHKTVGIRIPDFGFTDKLMGKFGYPLTATSANISGEEATGNINQVVESFKGQIWKPDLILDAGILPPSPPSTLLDLSTVKPKILRVGPSKPEQLLKLLGLSH